VSARAIWKGVVHIGTLTVPVKLYSAVQDRTIRFRLLHRTDHEPVKQQLVDETGDVVEYAKVTKAFPVSRGKLVALAPEELETLEPKDSRDIDVGRFVAPAEIDYRWFERAYWLGPDGNAKAYFAAAAALRKKEKLGIARWVMRDKSYVGALREEDGYLMLITLRRAEEVVDAESLAPPSGRALAQREVAMASQLLEALHGTFDASQFRDEYRARVIDLIEAKAAGHKPKVAKFRPRKQADDALGKTLEASLAGLKRKARG
jgi:DNA end-binding protein Ku